MSEGSSTVGARPTGPARGHLTSLPSSHSCSILGYLWKNDQRDRAVEGVLGVTALSGISTGSIA